MGGVAVYAELREPRARLFACGCEQKIAGGAHGANRLSSNATSRILVQGQAAGVSAAAYAAASASPDIPRKAWLEACDALEAPLRRSTGIRPHEVKAELQHVANIKVGMLRTGKSLEEALARVRQLRKDSLPRVHCQSKDRLYNKEWADAIECRSMLDALEATARAALHREESRGAHYRGISRNERGRRTLERLRFTERP